MLIALSNDISTYKNTLEAENPSAVEYCSFMNNIPIDRLICAACLAIIIAGTPARNVRELTGVFVTKRFLFSRSPVYFSISLTIPSSHIQCFEKILGSEILRECLNS